MQSFEASAPQAYKYLDNSSKLSEQNVLTGNLTYQYDLGTGRFISSNQASYSYETTTALPMSGRGQQTQSYAFNELGQRTRSLVGTSSAILGWSGERLTSFETSGTSAHYVYDSSGMRTQSSVTHLESTSDTKYAYDGLRLMELSQNGANPYRIGYLYEDQNSTPYAASYETSETALSFTLESNVRGDVIALRDTLGNVFATYSYGDYGEPQAITTNETELVSADLAKDLAERQALRYAGYLYDDYSGMYYCAARYYDPATQVFISLDPVRADGERSGYLYCNGDPINSVDLSGLWTTMTKHRINRRDADKDYRDKLIQLTLQTMAEDIALPLIFGPFGAAVTEGMAMKRILAASTVQTLKDYYDIGYKKWKPGDYLLTQRSDYLYFKPYCHHTEQWELRRRVVVIRKMGQKSKLFESKMMRPLPWDVRGVSSIKPLRIPHRGVARVY